MNNNVIILDAIRRGKNGFSKKDIHQETGMVWGTMCNLVNAMLRDGFIFARKKKPTGRGRPMVPLCINQESAFFVGLDIGAYNSKVVICNLAFNIIYRAKIKNPGYENDKKFFTHISKLLNKAIEESGISKSKIKGVGLSISGNIDSENGIIVSAGNMGIMWGANIPAAEILSDNCGLPVMAVNTNAASCWAEYHFGAHAGCGNLVTIGIGVGIGSGVVSNHHLLISQPTRQIGYIGHLLIPGNKQVCTCGFRGCLEAYAGGKYIGNIAAEKLPKRQELHSAPALDRAAENGDKDAAKIITKSASYIAVGIANMIQLYSPEALIFSGGQVRPEGFLFTRTLQKVNRILPPERRQNFSTDITIFGEYPSALGAARLAFERFF